LTVDTNYNFKVNAVNNFGTSIDSNVAFVLIGNLPSTPTAPVTIWSPDNVIIDWTPPSSSTQITSYTILI
jgi:hypothetical protein